MEPVVTMKLVAVDACLDGEVKDVTKPVCQGIMEVDAKRNVHVQKENLVIM